MSYYVTDPSSSATWIAWDSGSILPRPCFLPANRYQQLAASFKFGAPRPLKTFQKMLGLMAPASLVLQLGLLCVWPLQYWLKPIVPFHAWRHGCLCVKVDQACIAALAPWKDLQRMERGMPLEMVCRKKLVSADASNSGWGALCDN
ncbi:glutamate receptor delta-1-like protein [Labeo rohita]|uniref:Glutamate receptor delta-1-like protein n=1 Tax=Labeo rohita TaxID=84645 RepID=A0A498LAX7_LABRO|nr:glutamate receptor delta-1-like protein [Labeo rohita]